MACFFVSCLLQVNFNTEFFIRRLENKDIAVWKNELVVWMIPLSMEHSIKKKAVCVSDCLPLVEHSGVEPLTSSMRTRRTTNCANAPCMSIIKKRKIISRGKLAMP